MACLEGENTNTLFETLEDWERYLAHLDADLRCDDEHLE